MNGRALLLALGLALAIAGCSSDEFSVTGSDLPLDVSQDSLAVSLEPAALSLAEQDVVPDLTEPLDGRSLLFLGHRTTGGWRATPMLRFDFTNVPDDVDLSPSNWKRATIEFEMVARDREAGILRDVRLHELTTNLTASMVDTSLTDVLGSEIASFTGLLSSTQFNLELPASAYPVFDGWIQAGEHRGVALYDLTAEVVDVPDTLESRNSNFVALASNELVAFTVIDRNDIGESAAPELVIELTEPADTFVAFPASVDLTNFQRTPVADTLTLGAHLPSRLWLQFDPVGAGVPGNATVGRATLVLSIAGEGTLVHFSSPVTTADREPTEAEILASVSVTALGYRARADQAAGTISSLESILRASRTFRPLDDATVEIDVTDYVQRLVNGVFENTDGIMVSFFNETFELSSVDLHASTAATDSLRPRLDVIYTPPADFQE